MLTASKLIKASFDAGVEFFRPPLADSQRLAASTPVMVPIRSVNRAHREQIAEHLLCLSAHDRYLRFGYTANDEQIRRYVAQINFDRDELFGIYSRKLELLAMAHLAFSVAPDLGSCAEFGVSVVASARGRGYGARLFSRAVTHARNEGVAMMHIHALSENTAMLNIVRKAGATISREGSESEAYLRLPPADLDSRLSEIVEERVAQTDYRLKVQAKQFWSLLGMMQDVRRGVRRACERMPR